MMPVLVACDRAPGLLVERGVHIPESTQIAPYVTIYAGVELGEGVALEQGAIIGRPQQLDERSRSPLLVPGGATAIGARCRVGSGSVVVAGATIRDGSRISDLVLVREGALIGARVLIGRGTSVSHSTRIGDRTRVQNECLVGPWTTIDEDVLVGPRVTFVGDPTMGRKERGSAGGLVIGPAVRIGVGATIFPPATIGYEAVIGAAALVRGDVAPRTVVAGVPARKLRDVRDDELIDQWR